jgi:hypothetical protein
MCPQNYTLNNLGRSLVPARLPHEVSGGTTGWFLNAITSGALPMRPTVLQEVIRPTSLGP